MRANVKVRTALERLLLMPLWPFSVIKPEKLEETNICPVIKGISLLWETGVKISGRKGGHGVRSGLVGRPLLQGARGEPRAARGRAAWRKGHLILMEISEKA